MTGVPLGAGVEERIIDLAADSRIEEIPAVLQAGQESLISPVMAALQRAFADAIQTTFLVGAAGVAVALAVAFLTRNPTASDERPPFPTQESEAARAARAVLVE